MSTPMVSNESWEVIEPLLPNLKSHPLGGRPAVDNRRAFTGIVFVLKTGIPWNLLPQELGLGSGSTCWRRFAAWTKAGVWPMLHRAALDRLGKAGRIDWSWAVIDSASVRAQKGGRTRGPTRLTGPNPAVNAMLCPTPTARR